MEPMLGVLEPARILQQGARDEYDGKPSEPLADWLAAEGAAI